MNLEDFKSFRRVLKPPEVGSIPTHSRHFLLVVAVVIVVGAGGIRPAGAQEGDRWEGPSAFGRAVRSAVFPAWGQLTNGKTRKATVLFTAQTYLYTRILLESRRGNESQRVADALRSSGGSESAIEAAEADAMNHFDNRRNLLFWAIIAGFYGAIDAYVDAHLGDFEKELEEGRTLFGGVDPLDREIELGVRF